MVQFGGQTSVDIGHPLEQEFERRDLDCEISGPPSTRWTSRRTATGSTS